MKGFLQFVLIVGALLFVGYSAYVNQEIIRTFFYGEPVAVVDIHGTKFPVTVAETPAERARGLSGTESLPELELMLFVFDTVDTHGIWMKNMKYPIDILWVSEDFEIIHIERRVPPESYPRVFAPARPAKYVIEANAHFAETFNIQLGDIVVLPRL